jgi:cysteine synthase A
LFYYSTKDKFGVLSAIGKTPLVELKNLFAFADIHIYAKLEMLNPGGSLKDRSALNIVKSAFLRGEIDANTVVIESSSGNLGVGLAQVCLALKLRFICVVDPKITQQNLKLLRLYGAEIIMVEEPEPDTQSFLQARINRVKSLLDSIPNSFWCNQYGNLDNADAHSETMSEILEDCDREVDFLFCAVSSTGTLRGCSEYLTKLEAKTKVIAVDAVGSVIFGGKPGKRLIPGHGSARVPELFKPSLANKHVQVSDLECVISCHLLLREEAILAGGSSGGVISAIHKMLPKIPPNSTCVAILCDRGERYLDTIYSQDWVSKHFGDISHFQPTP